MLLRINYETKLKLEASVILIIPFIIVVHIVVVVLLSLLADVAALDSVTDVARRLSLLVMMLMRRRGGSWSSRLSWLDWMSNRSMTRLWVGANLEMRWTTSCTQQCTRVLYWRAPLILKL